MSVDSTGPLGPNQDDPKMSDPSPLASSPPPSPLPDREQEADASRHSLPVALVVGLFKLAIVGLIVYATYYATMTFAQRTASPLPPPLTDEQRALAKKGEELRAEGKKVLSSYGWVNPAVKSNVHIPVERAMELVAAEAARPPAPAIAVPTQVVATAPGVAPAAPSPTTTGATMPPATPVATNVPPAPAAPKGMPADQIYRLVCMACHDTDGKGKLVRLAMPMIPDLTDAKWQASRTDAELQHSILEGKESLINGVKVPLMLPMKDKLALAHTDVKDMVAFMRAFKGGKQTVAPGPGGIPAVGAPVQIAQGPAPAMTPVAAPVTGPSPTLPSAPAVPTPSGPTTTPAPAPTAVAVTPGPAAPATPGPTAAPSPATALNPSAPLAPAMPALPPALPANAVNTAARAEKLRAAAGNFNVLCIACHGVDGRGTAIRAAMPTLPDFTSRDFQTSHSSTQLVTSILEGKGQFMVPWNTKLTQDQARELVLFVRNFGPADLAAAEEQPAASPSTAEFDRQMVTLRQRFDDLERQLQALTPSAPAR
jgi:mono/diheme cytochrome c family protein